MEVLDAKLNRAVPVHFTSKRLLTVRDLTVNFHLDSENESRILKQITFHIAPAEIVGLLGESGAGKTTLARSLMRSLPENARFAGGSIHLLDNDLLALDASQLRAVRGAQISIIPQDSDVLNPVMRVGDQVAEVLRAHRPARVSQMRDKIYSLLAALGFKDCERAYRSYPHQLSGGERRRISIAQALICQPSFVVADEPTAWLDRETAKETLSIFQHFRRMYGTAFFLITHDPDALSVADRVFVMYAGEIVEESTQQEILAQPKHPYTKALLKCGTQGSVAQLSRVKPQSLPCIPGQAPDPSETQGGCAFSSRCGDYIEVCDRQHPPLYRISPSSSVRCVQYRVEV
jgi:oligopeptide/dipeptide ABC transporter ATP-binding protein